MKKFSDLKKVPVSAWIIHGFIFTAVWYVALYPLFNIHPQADTPTPTYILLIIFAAIICTIFKEKSYGRATILSSWRLSEYAYIFFAIAIAALNNAVLIELGTNQLTTLLTISLLMLSLYTYLYALNKGPIYGWDIWE